MPGSEHRMTQRLTAFCPEGHRLCRLSSALVDALGFDGTAGLTVRSTRGRVRVVGGGNGMVYLAWQCPSCNRAGLRGAIKEQRVQLAPFLQILAAQYAYGPASSTTRINRGHLSALLRELIPEGDPHREGRRDAVAALTANAAALITHAPAQPVDPATWNAIVGGVPELRESPSAHLD